MFIRDLWEGILVILLLDGMGIGFSRTRQMRNIYYQRSFLSVIPGL